MNFSYITDIADDDTGNGNGRHSESPLTYDANDLLHHNISHIRRDSITRSQCMGGVSWGPVSVGTWLKEEGMFHSALNVMNSKKSTDKLRTSLSCLNYPNIQNKTSSDTLLFSTSPYSNSSYLSNFEEQYCKDYSCCGIPLPGLHDLLKHYEDSHIDTNQNFLLNSHHSTRHAQRAKCYSTNNINKTSQPNRDKHTNEPIENKTNLTNMPKSNAELNNENNNRNTDSTKGNANNEEVFSVPTNEVFLNPTHNSEQSRYDNNESGNQISPQSSIFNPLSSDINLEAETDNDNYTLSHMNRDYIPSTYSIKDIKLSFSNSTVTSDSSAPTSANSSEHLFDEDMDDSDSDTSLSDSNSAICQEVGYIDDPARRLYMMDFEEHKPFKCRVNGCDKNYKNQNGLKYHKLHGHQHQKLQKNLDGTFSILDPNSNEPLLGSSSHEKNKPYRCEICGKRYKNLNGLKYHRGHSSH